ncbi:hypothetical protein BGX24_010097 [Mortierella sp. AD032]|nr:hypothetical protein BGX24_010097 [Mortierella sp. AD032]
MLANPNKYSLEKELLLPKGIVDKQQGLVKSRLQPTSSFTKFATFPNVAIWSFVAWLAMFFLVSSVIALPSSIKDTMPPAGGNVHFSRRDILSVPSSSNKCEGSLVNWDKAHMTVLPTKNLEIQIPPGPVYGTIEVRTGDVTNIQQMPEVHFTASVTENDNAGGLQLNQNAPGSTTSTFTLSVAPILDSSIPFCAVVHITVIIPIDATAPYYDGELTFVAKHMDVKVTSDLGQLKIGKISFTSYLGSLYAPSLRIKELYIHTEGSVIIESLRSYDNESPLLAWILAYEDFKVTFKTSPASQGTTEDSVPHSLSVYGTDHVEVDVFPDTESVIPNTAAGEWVPRPLKINMDSNGETILRAVPAEGQKILLNVESFHKVFVYVSDNYLGPLNVEVWSTHFTPAILNEKPGSASMIVYETNTKFEKIGVKQITGDSARLTNSNIRVSGRNAATLSFI